MLPAEIEAAFAHPLHDIAVADFRTFQRQVQALQMLLKSEIGHDGRDDARLRELATSFPMARDQTDQLVAINLIAFFVDNDAAIRIPIERNSDIRAVGLNRLFQGVCIGGADLEIDVEAIRFDPKLKHFRAKLIQGGGRDFVGGTVGAIDTDAKTFEVHATRETRFDDFHISRLRIIDTLGSTEITGPGEFIVQRFVHAAFDL